MTLAKKQMDALGRTDYCGQAELNKNGAKGKISDMDTDNYNLAETKDCHNVTDCRIYLTNFRHFEIMYIFSTLHFF